MYDQDHSTFRVLSRRLTLNFVEGDDPCRESVSRTAPETYTESPPYGVGRAGGGCGAARWPSPSTIGRSTGGLLVEPRQFATLAGRTALAVGMRGGLSRGLRVRGINKLT